MTLDVIHTHFHARVRSTMLLFLSLKGSGFNSIIELLQGIVHIYRLVVLVLGKLEEYLLNISPLFLSELLDNYQYKSGIKSNKLNNIYLNRVSIVVQQKRQLTLEKTMVFLSDGKQTKV